MFVLWLEGLIQILPSTGSGCELLLWVGSIYISHNWGRMGCRGPKEPRICAWLHEPGTREGTCLWLYIDPWRLPSYKAIHWKARVTSHSWSGGPK